MTGMIDYRTIGPDLGEGDGPAAASKARRLLAAAEGIPFVPPDDVPIEPLLFTSADYSAHTAVVKRFDALLRDVAWRTGGDPAGLRKALVKGEDEHDLLTSDTMTERTWASCMFRVDAVLSGGVLKILENNIGGAIGGVSLMHTLIGQHRQESRDVGGRVHFDDPLDARRLLYEDACRWMGGPARVALLATRRETSYAHPRYWSVETEFMARHGVDARFQEPEELAAAKGEFPVALRHFMPQEWKEMGIDLGLVRQAAENGTLMLAPESSFLLQNKMILAWLSAESERLSAADHAFLEAHLPWTRVVGTDEVTFRGRSWYLPELLKRHRADLVIKPVAGYGGYGVVVGRFASEGEWLDAVSAALESGEAIVQEYAEPDRVSIAFYDRTTDRARRVEVEPLLGFAVFGGRDAGCVVRHNTRLTNGVVNGVQGASRSVAGWYDN